MIEGSADQIPEARFVEALEFAHLIRKLYVNVN